MGRKREGGREGGEGREGREGRVGGGDSVSGSMGG